MRPNNDDPSAAKGMEGRGLAKGNPGQHNVPRAQHREGTRRALERVREGAKRDKQMRFTGESSRLSGETAGGTLLRVCLL